MNWHQMLVGSGAALVRTAIVGVLAYLALLLMVRTSGKRTLSKFSAYDFVVTVALGSTLATVIVSREIALAQGLVALVVLIGLQFAIAWLSTRFRRVRAVVRGEPALLLYRGEFLEGALRAERMAHEEVLAAARAQGVASLLDVEAAVLETDGTITIVRRTQAAGPSTLEGVRDYPTDP